MVALALFPAAAGQADDLVRFRCHGMMGGHQRGMWFDGRLDASFAYDPRRQLIFREKEGALSDQRKVALDGHVLRWRSGETDEFLDLSALTYGFDWKADEGNDTSYGRGRCTKTPS